MVPAPLAEQLRPTTLDLFVGQPALTGSEGIVRKLLTASQRDGQFPSLIFWGPPGCGKTTLARLIARSLNQPFHEFSAVNASVKDIEKVVPAHTHAAQSQLSLTGPSVSGTPLVFIDEIHRFNKTQQDALLPHVERGSLILLGATTENPSFSVITPLLSRCRVLVFEPLGEAALEEIVARAVTELAVTLEPDAHRFLLAAAEGDARVALNVLEIASRIAAAPSLTVTDLEQALQRRQLAFDRGGEEFFNTISAMHKAVRGSDPDAALYWVARMVEAGQDPLYVARRLIRAASEDIGLADPRALLIANAAYDACAHLGLPECALALAEAAVYLARAPKSNALYTGYAEAAADVAEYGSLPVPLHIRNAPTKLMKELGYGKGYRYEHSLAGEKAAEIDYLPDQLKSRRYVSERLPSRSSESTSQKPPT